MSKTNKLSLSAAIAATFTATAHIPVPGGEHAPIEFTFKYRDRAAYQDFIETLKTSKNLDAILAVASGWDLDDPFDEASITKLLDRYMGSAKAILNTYIDELTGARVKN